MNLKNIDEELLEDYSIDKKNERPKYIIREKKIKNSFSIEDLLNNEDKSRLKNLLRK